jgi:predicted CopG family antitoxin
MRCSGESDHGLANIIGDEGVSELLHYLADSKRKNIDLVRIFISSES